MTQPFRITPAKNSEVPILVSVPHCGTAFPDELVGEFKSELASAPDDTDWFVDTLYDFVGELGITMISAHYSRWVIDLNRDPKSKPLYTDGRIITELCPTTTFLGEALYYDNRKNIPSEEVDRRIRLYYEPYHNKVDELLKSLKRKYGQVLLWDCHSIREIVPTIQKDKFPDLILGDADGSSASAKLINTTLGALSSSEYVLSHNHPFKGGYITRHFGKPTENQHALQLEMTKVNYMEHDQVSYSKARSEKMRTLLKKNFQSLIGSL